jgi:hypothetical protein
VPRPATVADQQAYLYAGLRELACDRCGALVRVKKNSPEHTSIQWSAESVRGCAEFADRDGPTALIPTCTGLRDSVARAVREGRLEVRRP